ncbi:hypothetical protein FZC84_02605 [Rossellomorea vietnamensis]|uniref:Uncharacterized protein n=1 Tax=Rossellomorea vietnamensis TaxID=218284 RepID=A0A5D4MKN9_9BACI|nr:hypothetical protein [Rossellomorea vietnamensis]TYS01561.1 hypothetical protein FZC84_02605 [Rossellomorea vietnamensis]
MTINHSGTLGKDYFISYLKLVMNSKGCTAEQAKDTALRQFFKGDHHIYGQETYSAFLEAYSFITKR